jgi:hypothetical protein
MDNSWTWIVHGPSHSLGYKAFKEGYDAYFGNFRGIYPRKLAAWKDPNSYWTYNLDHLAEFDL